MLRIQLKPRYLVDVSKRTTACQVLGFDLKMPIAIAPTAMQRMAHADGEIATAKGNIHIIIILFILIKYEHEKHISSKDNINKYRLRELNIYTWHNTNKLYYFLIFNMY